ncbi:MAG: DivIVA domain-containing protein [Syntrophobacteraceae bacterium]|nr:DivIVA domain-containing protein [Syntrophobacteraceae bacterium]
MEMGDFEGKRFRKRLMGLDPSDVEAFLRDLADELNRSREENENLKNDILTLDAAVKEHREREKTIRAVLVTAQKGAEQVKANAEREAKLIVSEAEVKAEGILKEANNRLIRMEQEMSEMRRNRIQFGARMRSLLDSYSQMLDDDGKLAPLKFEEKQENPDKT